MLSKLIQEIKEINFSIISPNDILIAHTCIAKCFANDIRVCSDYFKDHDYEKYNILLELSHGENDTDNIQYEDYLKGDHWQFLDFFIKKRNLLPSNVNLEILCNKYESIASSISPYDRFQLLVQTEMEYHQLFKQILLAHNRDQLGYDFFLYYVQKHEEFDLEDGGHSDLLKKYFDENNEAVLVVRNERLKLFRNLYQLN